jgi:hypothetical protein
MPTFATKDDRAGLLRSFGISQPLIRLALGKRPSDLFDEFAVPYKVYSVEQVGRGAILVPLWEVGDTTLCVRRRGHRSEFLAYYVEAPERSTTVARSEQGLLANVLFAFLDSDFESTVLEADEDEIPELADRIRRRVTSASKALGFRYLAEVLALFQGRTAADYRARERALKRLIRHIDAAELADAAEPAQRGS